MRKLAYRDSISRLAADFAAGPKWHDYDADREYSSHMAEFERDGTYKNLVDAAIIKRIRARIAENEARALLDRYDRETGASYKDILASRLAKFRSYEHVPFPTQSKKAAETPAQPAPPREPAAANLGWKYEYGSDAERSRAVAKWIVENNKSALHWGMGTAAALAALNALRRRLGGRKVRFRDVAVPALLGFGGGYAGKALNALLGGMGYGGRKYDTSNLKPGDTVYVGLSGGGGSPGMDLDETMRKRLGEGNYAIFSYRDADKAADFVNGLPKGVNVRFFAHSYGGKKMSQVQARIKRDGVSYATADSVGWTGKLGGAMPVGIQYLPSGHDSSDWIARLGGRWNRRDYANTRYVNGGHTTMLDEAFDDFVRGGGNAPGQ